VVFVTTGLVLVGSGGAHEAGTPVLNKKQMGSGTPSAMSAGTVTEVTGDPRVGVPMIWPLTSATAWTTCSLSSGAANSGVAKLHAVMLRKTRTKATAKTFFGRVSTDVAVATHRSRLVNGVGRSLV